MLLLGTKGSFFKTYT